ncbi:MAG TPA: FtsX-like permease family protein [Chitinophagales bacterium]|nr:FtsX-like permease family protein [Chitinophagales bacterium]
MSLERFIARKILFNAPKSFSRYIVSIAVAAVALSLSVMIVAAAMVSGFQKEISSKVYGFWGHIHITKFGFGKSFEDNPVSMHQPFYPAHNSALPDNIRHIQVFANKAGIIKTHEQIEGIILKGIGSDFDWDFFSKYLVKGEIFSTADSAESRKILISSQTASRLSLDTGDVINIYFIQTPPRMRRFEVSGIYNSGLEEYDRYYALVDIRHVQRLNDWDDTLVSGFEVYLDDVGKMHKTADELYYGVLGPDLTAQTIKEIYPNIFDWLELQNMNEIIILVLMTLVAAINMITCLLILILERTNMVGVLKALGAENKSIQKIFLYKASYILALGLFFGNIIGTGICLLQKYFHIIRLPEESYYVSVAPVDLSVISVAMLNAGTFLVCIIAMLLPALIAGRITPVKAIRFE